MKLCECGCGEPSPVAKRAEGTYRSGESKRFIHGHHARGPNHPQWRGGRHEDTQGYIRLLRPGHARANVNGYVLEHVLLAQRALGRPIPKGSEVHHANGNPGDNQPGNLVLCEDRAYHKLLHRRFRAFMNCGHVDWVRCIHCLRWEDPKKGDFYISPSPRFSAQHRQCHSLYERNRNQAAEIKGE